MISELRETRLKAIQLNHEKNALNDQGPVGDPIGEVIKPEDIIELIDDLIEALKNRTWLEVVFNFGKIIVEITQILRLIRNLL